MATLNDLTDTLTRVTGLPKATAFAYGRFAREAGFIDQRGRGANAAVMTFKDASNLLLAVGGTAITREAGKAIKAFRTMKGVTTGKLEAPFDDWLKPLGFKKGVKIGNPVPLLGCDLGSFIEFLMRDASTGKLNDVLRSVPVPEIDSLTLDRYLMRDNSTYTLLEDHRVKQKAPFEIAVGTEEDVWIDLEFNRSNPSAWIHFRRNAINTDTLCSFLFRGPSIARGDLEVVAGVSQTTLASLAYCVANGPLPRHARSLNELQSLLFLSGD